MLHNIISIVNTQGCGVYLYASSISKNTWGFCFGAGAGEGGGTYRFVTGFGSGSISGSDRTSGSASGVGIVFDFFGDAISAVAVLAVAVVGINGVVFSDRDDFEEELANSSFCKKMGDSCSTFGGGKDFFGDIIFLSTGGDGGGDGDGADADASNKPARPTPWDSATVGAEGLGEPEIANDPNIPPMSPF